MLVENPEQKQQMLHYMEEDRLVELLPAPPARGHDPLFSLRVDLGIMRNKNSTGVMYRLASRRLMSYFYDTCVPHMLASRKKMVPIETPTGAQVVVTQLDGGGFTLLPVLTAGVLPALEFQRIADERQDRYPMPVHVSFIAITRNEETSRPQFEYAKYTPKLCGSLLEIEQMLATGGTSREAMRRAREFYGMAYEDVAYFFCNFAAPDGVMELLEEFPNTVIYTFSVDEKLNEINYIIPGCGDAGDRAFRRD